MASPSAPQAQQPFPRIGTNFLSEDGNIQPVWQRFLLSLWQKAGSLQSTLGNAAFVNTSLQVISVQSGLPIGTVGGVGGNVKAVAGVEQVLGPNVSPWTWTATGDGSVVVTKAKVEFSRGVSFYQVSIFGGMFPVLKGDKLRLTWFGADIPTASLFPTTWAMV